MAGQKNFEVDQNATFTFILEYKDSNGNAVNLTGASAKMQVRDTDVDGLWYLIDYTINILDTAKCFRASDTAAKQLIPDPVPSSALTITLAFLKIK